MFTTRKPRPKADAGATGKASAPADPTGTRDIELADFNFSAIDRAEAGTNTGFQTELPPRPPPPTSRKEICYKFFAYTAMALLFVGAQIPIYLFGAVRSHIYDDIGGADLSIWYIIANLIAMASISPFAGALSDIIGRRPVLYTGAVFMMIGLSMVLKCSTMVQLIVFMAITGIGAGMVELNVLVILREMAPRNKLPKHVASLVLCLVPFCPSVLWAQIIAESSTWRYCALLPLSCIGAGFLLAIAFYRPPPRGLPTTLCRREMLKRIDYLGGVTSAACTVFMLYTCFAGGSQNLWTSSKVPIWAPVLAVSCFVIFVLWEVYRARRLSTAPTVDRPDLQSDNSEGKHDNEAAFCSLMFTYLNGCFFYVLLTFWPVQYYELYGSNFTGPDLHHLVVGSGLLLGTLASLCVMSRLPKFGFELYISALIAVGGSFIMGCLNAKAPLDSVCFPLFLFCVGIGGGLIPSSVITAMATKHEHRALTTGLSLSLRIMGGFHAYAVLQAMFSDAFRRLLKDHVLDALYPHGIFDLNVTLDPASALDQLRDFSAQLARYGVDVDLVAAGRDAVSDAFAYVWFAPLLLEAGMFLFIVLVGVCIWPRANRGGDVESR